VALPHCLRAARILATAALLGAACGPGTPPGSPGPTGPTSDWPSYGGHDGQRYAAADEITPANVGDLRVAWTYHHGDVSDGKGAIRSTTAFEATPILADRTLYFCTPLNRVIALDAATGRERWRFDPHIDLSGRYANQLTCRGVEAWLDPQRPAGATCRRRIFTATNGGRLFALDAATGAPCEDFGKGGAVDLKDGVGAIAWTGEYQVTSPPAAAGDLVIVGSAVGDNQRTNAPSGVVRGYDARTGALRWAFDLAPPGYPRTPENTSPAGWALGSPNVWAPMVVDARRDLVFLPTGNPAPDYFHDASKLVYYGSSVVALRASTGEVVWHFQTVHHDLWDFDVPAQPTLATVERGGKAVPVVVQATKMGLVFVLDRRTGAPVFGVEERPVPQEGVPGEELSPTQPFPLAPPPLDRLTLAPNDVWGLTPWDRGVCRRELGALRYDGIYTPPTLRGSLMLPGNAGGSNWGGVAFDPRRGLVLANTMNLGWGVRLFPAADFEKERAAHPGEEVSPQRGTPYGLHRWPWLSPLGVPCSPPPWGTLAAIDLSRGTIAWQVKLGTVRDIAPIPIPWKLGTPNLGGPLVTASGLVFIGAAMDDYLRAFDVETGAELWKGRLPAGGQATPMSYRLDPDGPQYVVIAAGGHGRAHTRLGDALVAYTLGGRTEAPARR
jgi:quinoprotein glucose dehydrogenase